MNANARDRQILEFLKSPVAIDLRLERARAKVQSLRAELDSAVELRFADLANRRILASTSLSRRLAEREEWDAANAYVAEALNQDKPLSLDAVRMLNGKLTGSTGDFREVAVFGCDDAYLSPSALAETEEIFERWNSESDPLVRAAGIYIFVINVHPFLNGNGRTARLAADWVLLEAGYLPLCFPTSIQSHVAYAQADRYLTMNDCLLKCLAAVCRSYDVVLGRA